MKAHQSAILIATALAAASPAVAQKAPTTVQEDFVAAAALDEKGDRQAALAAWEALEVRTKGKTRNHALVMVRKSAALYALDRKDEAVVAARAGLADLPIADESLRDDRFNAYINLGRIAESALDYASAVDAYRQAEAMADTPAQKAMVLLRLAATATFIDPPTATAAFARADAVLAATKADPTVLAEFARRKGLLLLNSGDFAGARAKSDEAVKLLGGMTEKVDLRDVSARSDAAIGALLTGDSDAARRYMAYTGAGRMADGTFDPAVQMKAPDCGGDGGLKPADMAVIEFSIGDNGAVILSAPVYAAGGGKVALEFARAALGWSWTPEQVKQLPPFFRYNIRVEMRCSMGFERPSINDILDASLEAWMASKKLTLVQFDEGADAQLLAGERAARDAVEAKDGAQSLTVLPTLYRLMKNRAVPREEKNAIARRALAIADANGVPAMPRLAIDLVILHTERTEFWGIRFAHAATSLASQLPYATDPETRSALRLLIADSDHEQHSVGSRARELLQQVADDPTLAKNDPMRVGALVRIASIEQQHGNAVAARTAFENSGLAANQCGIVDSPPHLLHESATFPEEAAAWGFSGWAQTQFDVSADGRVVNERAILSYPPFVFTKAAEKGIASARYAKSYRPDGSLGCGASLARFHFNR